MATKLVYMNDFNVVNCETTVCSVKVTEDGRTDVVLEETCFYPRGGGQDWDQGQINDFTVEQVTIDDSGIVHHIGIGDIKAGQTAICAVDIERRVINTRLHSAGHVVGMAVDELNLGIVPVKGAHYPHMSFVEYEGSIEDVESALEDIQATVDCFSGSGIKNSIIFLSKSELGSVCRNVPDYIPDNKPTRVVMYGEYGVPCGGTHVENLKEIGKIEITKIKSKKGVTKISYRIEGVN